MGERLLYGYAEDQLSCAVMERLIEFCNLQRTTPLRFNPGFPENKKGCGNLKMLIPRIANMAKNNIATFVLTDLDTTTCSPELIRHWFHLNNPKPQVPMNLLFRVAEHEVESWLLADREGLSHFLGISLTHFSKEPDRLPDPKQDLFNILRRGRKKIHKQMLPSGSAHVGPEYNSELSRFVRQQWNIEQAANLSPSLQRAVAAIHRF